MLLKQDFDYDFRTLAARFKPDFVGQPSAFVRYADGEISLLVGRTHIGKSDRIAYHGQPTPLREPLLASLRCDLPGWHIGIACPCHEPENHRYCLDQVRAERKRLTFASIWIWSNYAKFQALDLDNTEIGGPDSRFIVVAPVGGTPGFEVPENGIEPGWVDGCHELAAKLVAEADRTILLSAGPLACIIAHHYWLATAGSLSHRRQTIIDVGSVLDERLKGRRTRRHQNPSHPTSQIRCEWPKPEGK